MHRNRDAVKKKITFLLEEDEDGYPPVAAEGIWAEHLGADRYELDNIPFFAREATLGDVVRVSIVEGETRYLETVSPSENSLLRVVYFEGVDPAMLRQRIEATGCSTEHDAAHALIAISVPAAVELSDVYASFEPEYSNEMLDYEEPILRH